MQFRRSSVLIVPTAALLALGGCSGGSDVAASADGPGVIVPGSPGGGSTTVPDGDVTAPAAADPNDVDVMYLQMMIPHHQQALTMTDIADGRISDPSLASIADRISAAQGPEIDLMESWLRQWKAAGIDVGGHGDHHDHSDMPGMATPEQLAELESLQGAEFDAMFIRLMSDHHQGAIDMSQDVFTGGIHQDTSQLAQDISSSQAVEIQRMQALLPD